MDPQAGLRLSLVDFANESITEEYPDMHDSIFLSAATLCAHLNKAEDKQLRIKQRKGLFRPLELGVLKQSREKTPPEELSPGREKGFQYDEQRALERSEDEDSSYDPSPVSEVDSS